MCPLSHTRHEGYIPCLSVRGPQLVQNRVTQRMFLDAVEEMTPISLVVSQCQVTWKQRVAKTLIGYRMVFRRPVKRRLRRAASRLRWCCLAFFFTGLSALLSLASLGAE